MWFRIFQLLIFVCLVSGVVAAQTVDVSNKLEALRAGYERAQRYERAGDWAAAEREWQQLVSVAPDDARAWTNLGVALNRQDKMRDALDAWRQAVQIDPKISGAHFNIGLTLVRAAQRGHGLCIFTRAD